MLEKLFSWPVITLVLGFLVALGGGALKLEPPAYGIAKLCFSLAALLSLPPIGYWFLMQENDPAIQRSIAFLIACVVIVLVWFSVMLELNKREKLALNRYWLGGRLAQFHATAERLRAGIERKTLKDPEDEVEKWRTGIAKFLNDSLSEQGPYYVIKLMAGPSAEKPPHNATPYDIALIRLRLSLEGMFDVREEIKTDPFHNGIKKLD